ncbi:MAG: glycoside hydrolase TIM-barrel-like domain-containing protein [Ignavibacteriae bacterium]|nr:glycoside hydrolase TIM-barrel-like domain-containing protein [Ignavibacteria bacterium]MBI3364444.1 glycoside hydrolase TIM-barrel-like domain-containing protein [Ignavibacteriota bacterium]
MNVQRYTAYILGSLTITFLSCKESAVGPIVSHHRPEINGFSYTAFTSNGFALGGQRNALGELRTQTNSAWIALTVFEYQSTTASSDIAPNTSGTNPLNDEPWSTTSTEDDIRQGVRQARSLNMKVMLKPHVDLYTGEWRANILPGIAWFASYTQVMMKYAHLAAELNIEMLCIGTEFIRATQHQYTPQWRSLIAAIRQQYKGKLVYAANWSGNYAFNITWPEYEQVEFWNDLDYIGIDAYYPLTNRKDDPQPSLILALYKLRLPAEELGTASARFGKPILFTEVGIQSVTGALATPWDYSIGSAVDALPDLNAQEFYYNVIIQSFGGEPWCAGMFWWNWESVASLNELTNYTPRNKPAAVTLKQWYAESSL